jgi:hypothetical protein
MMMQHLAIFNSDQVNAYGIKMPLPTLAVALEQGWLLGQPMFLSHDRHRLEGWTRALGIHLEPGLSRLIGLCFVPESQTEGEELKNGVYHFFGRRTAAEVGPHRPTLEERLKPFLRGTQEPVLMEAAALKEDGLAERTFAAIFAKRDKDGLVLLKDLHAIAPGVFEHDGLLLFASSYFRRSLSRFNTLNEHLLKRLDKLVSNPTLSVKVALDPHVVGLAETYRMPLEFAYWWGPKFNEDLLSIPRGITRHDADERHRLFSGISRTEFWWHEQKGLKTFECEEVLDIPSLGVGREVFGCRYVHSIVDPTTKEPVHLDGAIRLYDEIQMVDRLDKNMYEMGRHSEYTKLWRVDGPIPITTWKEVITHYFRDNELVGEYLGGRDESGHLRPAILHPEGDPLYRFVPSTMKPSDGVRISVAYHPPDDNGPPVQVIAHDTYGSAENRFEYVEADTIEVVKLLRRAHVDVVVPEGLTRLAFEDMSANLAMILHRGPLAAETAEQTLGAVRTLCDAWVRREDDRIVSFNIGVSYSDRTVYVSYAGHVVALQQFLQQFGVSVPRSAEEYPAWINVMYERLNELFPPSGDQPRLSHMLQETGILQFDRKFIDRNTYRTGMDENNRPIVQFAIPRDHTDLVSLFREGRITYADLWIIKRCTCSGCGKEYVDCMCSKYVDELVHQEITDAELCGLFWTNRPADERTHFLLE